eukprot:599270-Amphidinium_carterae.1
MPGVKRDLRVYCPKCDSGGVCENTRNLELVPCKIQGAVSNPPAATTCKECNDTLFCLAAGQHARPHDLLETPEAQASKFGLTQGLHALALRWREPPPTARTKAPARRSHPLDGRTLAHYRLWIQTSRCHPRPTPRTRGGL